MQYPSRLIQAYELFSDRLTDTNEIDSKRCLLEQKYNDSVELLRILMAKNAAAPMNQEEYKAEEAELILHYESVKSKLDELEKQRLERIAKRRRILDFVNELKTRDNLLTEFDETLFASTVDKVTVTTEKQLIFSFKDGTDVPYTIE